MSARQGVAQLIGRVRASFVAVPVALSIAIGIALVSAPTAQAAGYGTFDEPYSTGTTFTSGDWRITVGKADLDA